MSRTTTAAVSTAIGSLLAGALAYAAVVSDVWVFAVLPVVPAVVLASVGLGMTFFTRGASGLIVLGALLAVAGAVSAIGHLAVWGLQFDYVDTGREVPAGMARWDDITFVGSALICVASVILAMVAQGRAWSRSPR